MSFRGRFLLIVLFAAVVPLALIGVWLTRSVVRAGQDLLRSELDKSLQLVANGVERRWSYRSGELALLANNEVAGRVLTAPPSATLDGEDTQYLGRLVASLAGTIPSFEYHDAQDVVRWASPPPSVDTVDAHGRPVAPSPPRPTMTLRLPVAGPAGNAPLGAVVARLDLLSLIAVNTALRLPNGAKLQLLQRGTGASLLPVFAPDSLLARNRFTIDGADWLAVHRALDDPAITLTMAAPLGAYVEPFEHAARTGMLILAVVALVALLLSTLLTARLTASLERLALAAGAVAAGDFDHRVEGSGAGEVGRLAAAFNSMTESLRRTLAELTNRRALAAVGEYAASLSHQVRNGLTAVRVDLQRAQEKTTSETPARPLIDRALENVKQLDSTVSTSLLAAQGNQSPRRRVDLRAVLRSAAQLAQATFHERGVSCDSIGLDGNAAWVLGNALALEQLFLNLLLNSAQASPRGARAAITLDVNGAELRVMVSDSGSGISAEDLGRVLDPFFSTKADGTGLGLPIARQIAASHGGSLRIESAQGKGTCVEVRLPLTALPG